MKKRTFLIRCMLPCIFLGSAMQLGASEQGSISPFAQAPVKSFTGSIVGSKVRMRTQPSVEGHVVRETTSGELFAVVGEENDFYAISPPKNTKGYIFRTFVLDGKIEGDRVNVRLYPDIEAPVIARLNTGESVSAVVSDCNNKWLEIALPSTSNFYIAKEYIENIGPVDLITQLEKRNTEAAHHLSATFLFAQAEIQKPFEQIDHDLMNSKFEDLLTQYHDLPSVVSQATQASKILQEIYVQKKIAFLEGKADKKMYAFQIPQEHLEKLSQLGIDVQAIQTDQNAIAKVAEAAATTFGLATTLSGEKLTDKMLVWQPLEESLFHLWAAVNSDRDMEEFYQQEEQGAILLSGIIEPYNRPVKNRPGDFLLKSDALPVAFLYSTKINLEQFVGKKVTVIGAPRPNHNFAFPAYFVLDIE